jgi:hypothetical protein
MVHWRSRSHLAMGHSSVLALAAAPVDDSQHRAWADSSGAHTLARCAPQACGHCLRQWISGLPLARSRHVLAGYSALRTRIRSAFMRRATAVSKATAGRALPPSHPDTLTRSPGPLLYRRHRIDFAFTDGTDSCV